MADVSVYKAKTINVKLRSSELDDERLGTAQTLSAFGLRGIARYNDETLLHMSLGESKKKLSLTEQRHVQHTVGDALSEVAIEILDTREPDVYPTDLQESALIFEKWKFYPDPRHLQY